MNEILSSRMLAGDELVAFTKFANTFPSAWSNQGGLSVSHSEWGPGVIERVGTRIKEPAILYVRFKAHGEKTVNSYYIGSRITQMSVPLVSVLEFKKWQIRQGDTSETSARVTSEVAELALSILKEALNSSQLEQATKHYLEHCQPFLSYPEFQIRLNEAHYQTEVKAFMDQGQYDAADRLYREQCSEWWPEVDYRQRRTQAILEQQVVTVYAESSLSELDRLFGTWGNSGLPAGDFAALKLPKLSVRISRLGMPLSEEQMLACARPEQHRLIRARAGSGKTRMLAAHAALALHDEVLAADQILILAFNKKAAKEIGDRVTGAAGVVEFRNARTFHSLAFHLADHNNRQLIFNDGNLQPSQRLQSGFVERMLESILSPTFRELLYEFFRRELEQVDRLGSGLTRDEYLTFRRAMTSYTLGGEAVKSNGEKFIADFLFEHGIEYEYEKVYSWHKEDRLQGRPYRPDFSLMTDGKDFVLEHWAIDPEDSTAEVPEWWSTTTSEYREQILRKRAFWTERGIQLLETHSGLLANGREAFEARLSDVLKVAGIRCQKLVHADLVNRVAAAPRTVSRVAELFLNFISRAKKRGLSVDDVAARVRRDPDPEPRNRAFHELAIRAYAAYERRLISKEAMDFDDLLVSAADNVKRLGPAARLNLGQMDSVALGDLRWILIDEFQDFSELYYRLIDQMLKANPRIRIVAVGDDWQAINGYAGAQLSYFESFDSYFPNSGQTTVGVNRRSGRTIVEGSNRLMTGKGDPALPHKDFDGEIDIICVDKTWLEDSSIYLQIASTEKEPGRWSVNFELARALKACTEYIVKSIYLDSEKAFYWLPRVLLLARTGRVYGVSLEDFGKRLRRAIKEHSDLPNLANFAELGGDLIEVTTAHKAKGKEADTVIVLDATSDQFPLIHTDNQLYRPFGVEDEDVLAEERRLFYVAVTRAEYKLMILTDTDRPSPYIKELLERDFEDAAACGVTAPALSEFARRVQQRLKSCDQEQFIRDNITPEALSAWERLRRPGLGRPAVGHSISDTLHAELAWPEVTPPIAILTGRHKQYSQQWRDKGWRTV